MAYRADLRPGIAALDPEITMDDKGEASLTPTPTVALPKSIEDIRKSNPFVYGDASDQDVLSYYRKKNIPDMPQEEFNKALGYTDPNEQGSLSRGAEVAYDQFKQVPSGLLAGVGAGGETLFGEGGLSTAIKKYGLEGYEKQSEAIRKISKPTDSLSYSYNEAINGNPSAMVEWAKYGLGYGGVQIAAALATRGLGTVAGKFVVEVAAKEIVAKTAEKELVKLTAENLAKPLALREADSVLAQTAAKKAGENIVKWTERAAMGAYTTGMEGSEIGGSNAQKTVERGSPLTPGELGQAAVGTGVAVGLEYLQNMMGTDLILGKGVISTMTGAGGLAARTATKTGAGMLGGGLTEFGQTGAERFGEGKPLTGPEAVTEYVDSAGLGGLTEGAAGTVGGLMSKPQPKVTPPPAITGAGSVDEAIDAATNEVAKPLALPHPAAQVGFDRLHKDGIPNVSIAFKDGSAINARDYFTDQLNQHGDVNRAREATFNAINGPGKTPLLGIPEIRFAADGTPIYPKDLIKEFVKAGLTEEQGREYFDRIGTVSHETTGGPKLNLTPYEFVQEKQQEQKQRTADLAARTEANKNPIDRLIAKHADASIVPHGIVDAVATVESHKNQFDKDGKVIRPLDNKGHLLSNAIGVMQIIPRWHRDLAPDLTLEQLAEKLASDTEFNIASGAKILRQNFDASVKAHPKYTEAQHWDEAVKNYYGSPEPGANDVYLNKVHHAMANFTPSKGSDLGFASPKPDGTFAHAPSDKMATQLHAVPVKDLPLTDLDAKLDKSEPQDVWDAKQKAKLQTKAEVIDIVKEITGKSISNNKLNSVANILKNLDDVFMTDGDTQNEKFYDAVARHPISISMESGKPVITHGEGLAHVFNYLQRNGDIRDNSVPAIVSGNHKYEATDHKLLTTEPFHSGSLGAAHNTVAETPAAKTAAPNIILPTVTDSVTPTTDSVTPTTENGLQTVTKGYKKTTQATDDKASKPLENGLQTVTEGYKTDNSDTINEKGDTITGTTQVSADDSNLVRNIAGKVWQSNDEEIAKAHIEKTTGLAKETHAATQLDNGKWGILDTRNAKDVITPINGKTGEDFFAERYHPNQKETQKTKDTESFDEYEYHPGIAQLADSLAEGGGIVFGPDKKRSGSVNPEWFKNGAFTTEGPNGGIEKPHVTEIKRAVKIWKEGGELNDRQHRMLKKLSEIAKESSGEANDQDRGGFFMPELSDEEKAFVEKLKAEKEKLKASEIGDAIDYVESLDDYDALGNETEVDNAELEKFLGINNEEKRSTGTTASTETPQPEDDLLSSYTEGELTDREKEAQRLARQKKDADLKAKLKEESDRSVATLEDEMLGIGKTATAELFEEPRRNLDLKAEQKALKDAFEDMITSAYRNGDIEIDQLNTALNLLYDNKFEVMKSMVEKGTPTFDANFQRVKSENLVNLKDLLALIGSAMYSGGLVETSIKEMAQNSFDAVKAEIAKNKALKGKGLVEVNVDSEHRLIAIKDNGIGMSSKTIADAFLTIAGTDKGGLLAALSSGGFGMAKAVFLYGNEKIWLRTVYNGKLSVLITSPEELLNPKKEVDIKVSKTDEPNGTVVVVQVPETQLINGKQVEIRFPYSYKNIDFFDNPLLSNDVEFNFSYTNINVKDSTEEDLLKPVDIKEGWNKKIIPIGKHQDMSGYKKDTTAKFDWGSADIYIGIERKQRSWQTNHRVLSAGIFQFEDSVPLNNNECVPYNIIIDVHSDVKASSPSYPFNIKREGWKDLVIEDITDMKAYIAQVIKGFAAQDTADMFKRVTNLPLIDVTDTNGGDEVSVESFIRTNKKPEADVNKASYIPPNIDISGGKVTGLNEEGEETVFVDSEEKAKNRDSSFNAGKNRPMLSDYMLNLGLDVNSPIYLNNTSEDYLLNEGETNLDAVKLFSELGSIIVKMREHLRTVSLDYGWSGIRKLTDYETFVGISIDKEYHGVHINVPFHGIFLNPLAIQSETLPGISYGLYDTLVHEFNHIGQGKHDENFIIAYHQLAAKLAEDGFDVKMKKLISRTLKKYQTTFERLKENYDKSTTKNLAESIHKGEGVTGTTSKRVSNANDAAANRASSPASGVLQEGQNNVGGRRLSTDAGLREGGERREAPAKNVGYLKSTRETAKGTGSTVEQVKAWLPARAAKAVTEGKIKIAKNLSELRQLLGNDNPAIRDEDFGDTEGFYDPHTDTIYLIANAVTKATLRSAFAHESGHRALAIDPQLKAALAKFDGDLQNRFDLAGKGLGTPIEKAAYRRVMQSETTPENRLEEFKTYLISEYAKDPSSFTGKLLKLIKDMVAAMRVALLKQGLDFGMVRQLSPADLLAMSRYGSNVKATNPNGKAKPVMASTEGIGETVDVDGRLRPTRDSNGDFIHPTIRGQKNFWRWFHGSEVVDDEGRPIPLYHGTTSDFASFDKAKAYIESDLGGGFYFTNTEGDVGDNYAGEGPDMKQKIRKLAESYAQDFEQEGYDYDEAQAMAEVQARQELMPHGGMTMKVYVKMENPVVLSHSKGKVTFLNYEQNYDEDTDDYEEPTGTLVDFVDALNNVEADFDSITPYSGAEALYQEAQDWGGMDALDIIAKLQDAYTYADNENGEVVANEIIRRAFEESGFDGYIDNTVDVKFGSQKRIGKPMTGMNPDTVHYIVFSSENVKSAIGNNGDFDPSNTDIRRSQVLRSTKDTDIGNLADLDTLLSSGRLPQEVTGWRAKLDKITDWLVDSTREFDVWTRQFADQELAGKMVLAKDRSTRKSAIMEKTALDKFMKPFAEKIESIAANYKVQGNAMNFRAAKTLVGRWMTARYALQKNRDYLAQDAKAISDAETDLILKMRNDTTDSVNRAEAALNKLKAKAKPGQTFKVQEAAIKKLKRFEQHAQNGDYRKVPGYGKQKGAITRLITKQRIRTQAMQEQRIVDPTLTPLEIGLAGGFNNFTAQHYLDEIEKVIPKRVLQDASKNIYDMNTWKLHQDLLNGKVTQQQVTEWNLSPIYVPLTGDPSVDTSEDSMFGHGSLNQTTDHRAVGRASSLSQDGVDASVEQVQKSARYHGWADFKADFEELYEGLVTEKTAPGMTRKEAEEAVMRDYHISKHAESKAIPQSPSDIIIRRNGVKTVYNIHNQAAVNALKRLNEEQVPGMLAMPAKFVQMTARLVTVFMPMFGMSNAIRDTWEKSENIRFRTLPGYAHVDMNKVGSRAWKIAAQNPLMVKKIMGVMLEGTKLEGKVAVNNADPDVILLRELITEGGTSTVGDFLSSSSETLSQQMEESIHWGREILQAVTAWNNAFELMSSFSVYKALKEQGVDTKTAAGSVLNLMNFNKSGSQTGLLRALYMFVNPTFQGGHQLIQTLSTPGGQRRAMGYLIVGSAIYMMLRMMAGDDDKLKRNKLDMQSNSMLERNIMIPLPWDTDTFVKIPMGFGLAQLTWGVATNLVKVLVGDKPALDAGADIFKSATRTIAPIQPSEASVSEHFVVWLMQTFTPQIVKPFANVAMDVDAFGRNLTNAKFGKADKPLSWQGRKTTPMLYKQLSAQLGQMGIETYPESIREVVNGYLPGLLHEVIKATIENPNKEALGRNTVSPFIDRWIAKHDTGVLGDRLYFATREKMDKAATKQALGKHLDKEEQGLVNLLPAVKKIEGKANGILSKGKRHATMTDIGPVTNNFTIKRAENVREKAKELVLNHIVNN